LAACEGARAPNDKLKLIISPERIQRRVAELAAQLSADLQGREVVCLGILKGAFIFLGDLARHMSLPVMVDFVRLRSYGNSSQSSGKVEMTKPPELDLGGRTVLLVEDIVDTGLTLSWLVEHLHTMKPEQVLTCALVDKPERRQVDLELDYVGFNIPRGFLVGYGLDYDESYRCLPGIYEVEVDH
jgi:hypoxanthine phosphoribosyltransferase